MTEIKRLLRDQIERIWGGGEVALVDANYADIVVDHMPTPGQPGGREALKDVVRAFREALPDMRMTLHGVLARGEFGVDFWTLEGTHEGALFGVPPTGKRVRFSGIDMVRAVDGRIAELWHVEELAQFQAQIGLPPGPGAALAEAEVKAAQTGRTIASDAAALTAQERAALEAAHTLLEEGWGVGRAPEALFAPACADLFAEDPAPGSAVAYPFLDSLRATAQDVRLAPEAYVVEGARAAMRWRFEGAQEGRRFLFHAMAVIELGADGRIVRLWRAEERARLAAQLG